MRKGHQYMCTQVQMFFSQHYEYMSLCLKEVVCQTLKIKKIVHWNLELGIESDMQLQERLFWNLYINTCTHIYLWSHSVGILNGKNLFWQLANTVSLAFTFNQGKAQIYTWSEKPMLIRCEHLLAFNCLCLHAPLKLPLMVSFSS